MIRTARSYQPGSFADDYPWVRAGVPGEAHLINASRRAAFF